MRSDQRRSSYEGWVRAHAAELCRFAHRLCGRPDVAEELVQETFYHAWRSIGSLKEHSKARAWLFQILRHRYSHLIRDQSRRPRASANLNEARDTLTTDDSLPVDVMVRQEAIERALEQLDERYKVPFLMVFLEGSGCSEVARELDIPLGTVLSRIHRARQHLRASLENEGTGSETARMRIHRPDDAAQASGKRAGGA